MALPGKCPACGQPLGLETAADEKITCPNCCTVLMPPSGEDTLEHGRALIGHTLGQFEVIELLGSGAMGDVYKARQALLDRFVAVKVLRPSLSTDAAFVERFRREARAAAAVGHPNIVQVHDVGCDRSYQYIAMEFVDGRTLRDVLERDGALPVDRALAYMVQATAGLAAAHALGIVHRDLKPANMLITSKGVLKIADFGLAKRREVDASVTAPGTPVGTLLYMPPEVLRGQPADQRSDLYSLGATFYHALAGRPPFEAATSEELVVKHLECEVPALGEAAPHTPPQVCCIVHRLLQKAPSDRFQSAEELLSELEAAEATPSCPDRGKQRNRYRSALVVGGCVLALAALPALLVLGRKPSHAAPALQAEFALSNTSCARVSVTFGIGSSPSSEPSLVREATAVLREGVFVIDLAPLKPPPGVRRRYFLRLVEAHGDSLASLSAYRLIDGSGRTLASCDQLPKRAIDSPSWLHIDYTLAPVNVEPASGPVGSLIALTGSGFGTEQGRSVVHFGSAAVPSSEYTLWSDTKIICRVPLAVASGQAGDVDVVARVEEEPMDPATFSVTNSLVCCVDDDNTTGLENGSETYPFSTIQEGVESVYDGGTVKVAQGRYTSQAGSVVSVQKKAVLLVGGYRGGASYPDTTPGSFSGEPNHLTATTVIDGGGRCRGVLFSEGRGEIRGFVITGGRVTNGPGGGICVLSSTLRIADNDITGNSATTGGGVYLGDSVATVETNSIAGNALTASGAGGGVCCVNSTVALKANTVTGNSGGGGGGVCYSWGSKGEVSGNTLENNQSMPWAGAGILCAWDSAPTIVSNLIRGNTSLDSGGGVHCVGRSSPLIEDNEIRGNKAENGGGVSCAEGSSPTVSRNLIAENTATGYGGGIWAGEGCSPRILGNRKSISTDGATLTGVQGNSALRGGGISCVNCSVGILVEDNHITGNQANWGGAIYDYGSPIVIKGNTIVGTASEAGGGICLEQSVGTVRGNTLRECVAARGGGIHCANVAASSVIEDNTVARCHSLQSGGAGVLCQGAGCLLRNNVIVGNQAGTHGGGIWCLGGASPRIVNNTLAWNRAARSGGGISATGSSPVVTNCILWNHGNDLDGCSAKYSCIRDGSAGEGNINLAPCFLGANEGKGPDSVEGTHDDDYRLDKSSPCANKGRWGPDVLRLDRDGRPRPAPSDTGQNPDSPSAAVDMGAYTR